MEVLVVIVLFYLHAVILLAPLGASLVFFDEIFPTAGMFPNMRFADQIRLSDEDLIAVRSQSRFGLPDRNTTEGRISIYQRLSNTNSTDGWMEVGTMTAVDKPQGANFASSFEFYHDEQSTYLIVGAGGLDKKNDGIVYVYSLATNEWILKQRLFHPTVFLDNTGFRITFKNFGSAIAVHRTTIAVASLNEAVFFYTTNSTDDS